MKTIKMKAIQIILVAIVLFAAPACNKKGCTDPLACNYDSSADIDDGTCNYNCGGGNGGYNCVSGTCTYSSSGGAYSTLSSCQSSCGSSGNCTFTQVYAFQHNCAVGSSPVSYSPLKCCSNSLPFYCTSTNKCYSSCETAKASCGSNQILKNPGGNNPCSYVLMSTVGNCGNGYYRVANNCCPESAPFACSNDDVYCYKTCYDAELVCKNSGGTVYKAKI